MWWRTLLAGGLLAGLLGACAIVDPVDSRYDTITRSLAKARNEAIFLNLVRASHDYPLSFTTIANVNPNMSNTSTFALPSFSLGPANCLPTLAIAAATATRTTTCTYGTGFGGAPVGFGNSTASNATAVSSNFNVSTQETGAFYDGFLRPIDLVTLNYFIRQNYSREMLFWLFADTIEIRTGRTAVGYQYGPPASYGCPRHDPYPQHLCLSDWIVIAVLAGLTVEETSIKDHFNAKYETRVVARFCFNPLLGLQAANQMGEATAAELRKEYRLTAATKLDPLCGSRWDPKDLDPKTPQPDTFNFSVDGQTFEIVPRSAYGVFEFLGTLMKMERDNVQPSPDAYLPRPDVADPVRLLTVPEDPLLIKVVSGNSADCFAHTWFYDGDYCVPEEATNTKRIFSLLAQLIAIQTAASDLSITPIVRVVE